MRRFTSFFFNKAVFLMAAAMVFFSFFPINKSVRKEEHWHSLLLEQSEQLDHMEAFLLKNGMTDIKSSNSSVYYSDFFSLNEIAINQLSDRLLPEDVRFDPVLKAISDLFTTPGGERLVFKSTHSVYELILIFKKAGTVVWEQNRGILFFIGPLVYLLLGFLIIVFFRKKSFFPLLVYFSWLPFLFYGDYQWGNIITPLILLEISILDETRNANFYIPTVLALFMTGIVLLFFSKNVLFIIQIVLTLLLVLSLKQIRRTEKKQTLSKKVTRKKLPLSRNKFEHNLFEPVYFNKEKYSSRGGSFSFFGRNYLFLLFPFILMILLPFPEEENFLLKVPRPEEITKHLTFQRDILYRQDWYTENSVYEYTWDKESGHITPVPLQREGDQVTIPSYDPPFIYSFLINSFLLERTLGFSAEMSFYKYIIFSIMVVFFLYIILCITKESEGKSSLFFISNRRGRKVA